jgi:hypothetical protein
MLTALLSFVLSRKWGLAAAYTDEICKALAGATCAPSCRLNEGDRCECNAISWQCDVYFTTRIEEDDYISGSGYVDCFRGSVLDCSVNVMDARYHKGTYSFSPGECNSRTCKDRGISIALIIGLSVACAVLVVGGIAFAFYWFRVRRHNVVVKRLSDSLTDVENPPEHISQQV